MKMTKNNNGIWWKILIVFTFILSISCLGILINNRSPEEKLPEYKYKTEIIELRNNNFLINKEILEYVCDENVGVSNYPDLHYFYASTWEGDDGDNTPQDKNRNGRCMIKYKVLVE